MTNLRMIAAFGAVMVMTVASWRVTAQDDLDDLLKDLEGESAKPAEKAETKAGAEVAENSAEAKAEEAEVQTEEKAETAEEKAAETKAEGAGEEAQAEVAEEKSEASEKKAEVAEEKSEDEGEKGAVEVAEKKTETPSSNAEIDQVLSLLDELAAETPAKPVKVAAKVEEKAAAEEAKPEVEVAEEKTEVAKEKAEEKVAAKSVAKPKGFKKARPDAELIENLATTERLRRESLDAQAKREILLARESMGDKEYTEAVRHYGLAGKLLNDSPAMKSLRQECDQGIAEGLYRAAMREEEIGRHARAVELMEKALDMRHPKARRALEKWNTQSAVDVAVTDFSEVSQRQNEEDYKANRASIRRHLRRARQCLALRDMQRALEECEVVLKNDPYNQEAIRVRNAIQKKRQTVLQQERKASRDGMIADVDEAWRPVYAVNSAQLAETTAETVKSQAGEDPERTQEQEIEKRMKEMRLPTIEFKPPATIIEAVEFFRTASRDYDRPDIPVEKRGFNFVLRTPVGAIKQQAAAAEEASDDFAANESGDAEASANGLPPIPKITASDISFYDALKLVCDSVEYKFIVRGPIVMVMQKDMSTAELLSRKYNVPEAFMERVTTASDEMKEMGGFGSSKKKANDDGEESKDTDWKAFFEEMGVKWPEGSSIKHIKTLGKLYVRNTRENLAEFEKVLDELGGQPQLIEIETRFVEVSQQDLNSLGFEWILNKQVDLMDHYGIGKALGLKNYESAGGSVSTGTTGDTSSSATGKTSPLAPSTSTAVSDTGSVRVNPIGETSDYQNGNRYLSTVGNHISGEAKSTNDRFMRVNAFLGDADLSMILHMLSQRNDTDLLSAPKVVTKSGETATMKVVTEYIYPQDYNVQLQSSSSSGGGGSSSSGGSSSAILAVVEPQNFTTKEVGVILEVLPTYNEANGGTIDLELKPTVTDEPTWYNYGMQIPFTGNPSTVSTPGINWITDLGTGVGSAAESMTAAIKNLISLNSEEIASKYVSAGIDSMNPSTLTYYEAPMKQPFFPVRSLDSKVSITPGATVVMGGLITEQRKAMDDKVPFLGDLPYIGRLFRSHAEQTSKRNLLIFVTGRLITPAGRELQMNVEREQQAEVKAAPKAE